MQRTYLSPSPTLATAVASGGASTLVRVSPQPQLLPGRDAAVVALRQDGAGMLAPLTAASPGA